jgi:hypothetical protein
MALDTAAMTPPGGDRHIRPDKPPPHDFVVELWRRTASRLTNRAQRILTCRQLRRGLLTAPLPAAWEKDTAIREWITVALPERQLLDLNLVNVLGEGKPELSRIPLGTTNQAVEDGEQLETYSQSAFEAAADVDAVVGLLIQDGEFGAIVSPSRAGPEQPPQYVVEKPGSRKGPIKEVVPNPLYSRDKDGKATKDAKARNEKKSKAAYDEAFLRWQAEHPLWNVRLVEATDCAPLFVRGRGKQRWECKGLLVRTLYDKEELLAQGFSWESMGKDVLIPRDFDAGRTYGNGGQIYLYEAYLMLADPKRPGRERPVIVYTVGGDATWDGPAEAQQAAIIDCEKEYGLTERFWDYFYGLHFEEDPDFRGWPFIGPVVQTIRNHETTRMAVRSAMWDNSFTGHVEQVNPGLPDEVIVEGFEPTNKTTPKPKPGETVKALGPVTPYAQAQVGPDAYRMLALDKQDLDMSTPDAALAGGDTSGASGHALTVGQALLTRGKRQVKQGVLRFAEFVASRQLMIGCAAMAGGGGQPKTDAPVFVTEEEQLDDGDVREKTSVLLLEERWVGGQYHLKAEFPAEGNLAEIDLMRSLAKDGFATDEDVDAARGIKNSTWAQVKRAIYEWRKSPEGKLEIQQRAAQFQGNQDRIALLKLVQQTKSTPSGGPTAAIAPEVPGAGVLGANQMPGAQPQGPGGGGGGSIAQHQRAGIQGGQLEAASVQHDAAATAGLPGGGGAA